jgi:hypothetical protein
MPHVIFSFSVILRFSVFPQLCSFFDQNGSKPACKAAADGDTVYLALLLANKSDINEANEVRQLNIYEYLNFIDK